MPNPNYDEFPITFEKGLTTEIEESVLEEGQLAELTNWEPTPQGGLRARNAWSNISTSGLPANRRVRGWGTIAIASTGGGGGGEFQTDTVEFVQFKNESGYLSGSEVANTPASSMTVELTGVTPGHALIAATTRSLGTVSSFSAGWTDLGADTDTSYIDVYTKRATSSTESFTITTSASGLHELCLMEIANINLTPIDAQGTFDLYPSPSTGGHTFTDTSHNPAAANSFLLGVCMEEADAGSHTPDSGAEFTLNGGDISLAFNANFHSMVAGQVLTSSAAYTPNCTTSSFEGQLAEYMVGFSYQADDLGGGGTPVDEVDFYIVMALANGGVYEVYRILRDDITSGTWELLDSSSATDTSPYVAFAQGSGYLVWTATTISIPRSILLSGPTPANITDLTDKSGRAVAFHKDRMFMGGETDAPARLYFSAIADPTDWTTATDFIDIGGDDGEAIQDLVSVEGLLLVCKTNRLYLISGSGVESFFVNELPGGTASAGRPAVRTPYGTIVAGSTDVWVVQGGGVDPLSRSLGAEYEIVGLVSTAYAQDIALISDASTGMVYRVNLVTGSWSKEVVTFGENQTGHLFSLQGRFYYGVTDSNSQVGGTRRLNSARSADSLTSSTVYSASTGRVAMNGPSIKYTPQKLFLQTRLQNTGDNVLHITLQSNITSTQHSINVTDSTQRDLETIGQSHKGCEWMQLHFDAAASPEHPAIDIERLTIGAISERNR